MSIFKSIPHQVCPKCYGYGWIPIEDNSPKKPIRSGVSYHLINGQIRIEPLAIEKDPFSTPSPP